MKKKKFPKKEIINIIRIGLIVIFINLVVYSSMNFVRGLHNVDASYNTEVIGRALQERNITVEFTDTGSDFVERDMKTYYIAGMNQLESSFIGGLFSMLLLGLIIAWRWE